MALRFRIHKPGAARGVFGLHFFVRKAADNDAVLYDFDYCGLKRKRTYIVYRNALGQRVGLFGAYRRTNERNYCFAYGS